MIFLHCSTGLLNVEVPGTVRLDETLILHTKESILNGHNSNAIAYMSAFKFLQE